MSKSLKDLQKHDQEPLKVLVIASVWPEPKSSAAGSRTLAIIDYLLSNSCKVVVASASTETPWMASLDDLGVEKRSIPLNDSALDGMLTELAPDWVVFDKFITEEQFAWRVESCLPQAMRVLDTIDLHSLRHARQLAAKDHRELEESDFDTDIARREIAAIYRSDLSLVLTKEEADLLSGHFNVPPDLIHVFPMTAPAPDFESWTPFSERQHFIHIGNFRHPPNWDAVQWLHREIWPIIRKQLPQAELHIYGSYAPPKATQLHSPRQGFYMCGRADHAQETMSRYRVCLAPLRFGAGMKGKLLDAFQTGTPSITTSTGAEGMHGEFPWPGIIEPTPEKMAQSAMALYVDESKWSAAQSNIHPILTNHLHHQEHLDRLEQRLHTQFESLEIYRQRNFIGSMLRHHTLRSTEYMARWIEAKNKHPETTS